METISIAMATYNGAAYLDQQLKSLLAQTRLPDEIVVTDDNSTDDTFAILEAFAKTTSIPVRLFRNEQRLNWRENFFKAAGLCSGDLIAFCDQDDIWLPEKLAKVAERFGPNVKMLFHNAEFIDGNGDGLGKLTQSGDQDAVYPPLSLDCWISILGFSVVFRRELLDYNWLYGDSLDKIAKDTRAAHDQWIFFIASLLGDIVYMNEPLVKYRLHGRNSMGFRRKHGVRGIISSFRNSGMGMTQRYKVLESRLRAIEAIQQKSGTPERFGRAHDVYGRQVSITRERMVLYSSLNPVKRLSKLLQLMRSGVYGQGELPLTKWDFRKDLLASVLGRQFMRTA